MQLSDTGDVAIETFNILNERDNNSIVSDAHTLNVSAR